MRVQFSHRYLQVTKSVSVITKTWVQLSSNREKYSHQWARLQRMQQLIALWLSLFPGHLCTLRVDALWMEVVKVWFCLQLQPHRTLLHSVRRAACGCALQISNYPSREILSWAVVIQSHRLEAERTKALDSLKIRCLKVKVLFPKRLILLLLSAHLQCKLDIMRKVSQIIDKSSTGTFTRYPMNGTPVTST